MYEDLVEAANVATLQLHSLVSYCDRPSLTHSGVYRMSVIYYLWNMPFLVTLMFEFYLSSFRRLWAKKSQNQTLYQHSSHY